VAREGPDGEAEAERGAESSIVAASRMEWTGVAAVAVEEIGTVSREKRGWKAETCSMTMEK